MNPPKCILLSGLCAIALMAVAPSANAQIQTTGAPGSPSATTTIDGKTIPNPPQPFEGKIGLTTADSKPGWPATVVPPQGRAKRPAHHDRRSGLRSQRHLRRRHPDSNHGSHCQGRFALHAVSLHRALLADAGGGMAKGGTGVLWVDGKEVETKKIPHAIPSILTVDDGFDIGVDTRLSVDDNDYQPPFRFTGKSLKVTLKLGPSQILSAADKAAMEAAGKARD